VDKGCYSEDEIHKALQDAEAYKAINRDQPGFFDVAINAGGQYNYEVCTAVLCVCSY